MNPLKRAESSRLEHSPRLERSLKRLKLSEHHDPPLKKRNLNSKKPKKRSKSMMIVDESVNPTSESQIDSSPKEISLAKKHIRSSTYRKNYETTKNYTKIEENSIAIEGKNVCKTSNLQTMALFCM